MVKDLKNLTTILMMKCKFLRIDNCSNVLFYSYHVCSDRIMKSCWMVRPADRPTFTQLRKSFEAMLLSRNRQSQYYLEMSPEKETIFSVVELPQHNDTGTLTRSNMYVKIV